MLEQQPEVMQGVGVLPVNFQEPPVALFGRNQVARLMLGQRGLKQGRDTISRHRYPARCRRCLLLNPARFLIHI